ncbi:phage tail tape measure protein [Corynebacterium mastitidis]|uniref:phage tail tape measure protein n=1 Tax=Corynebacterium mastitidis TaxID=161890 RepID=UPI000378164E|nr:phage tail tape measure protein [Corynebacterium mastitidis]
MTSAVWVPVNASMKGFVAEVVKQASGAASKGSKTLAEGFSQGGKKAGEAAAQGLASQASQVEKASAQLASARTAEAKASADVTAAEAKLEALRKNAGASASQIARAEQQLETAKNRQGDAAAKVARSEKDLEAVRGGGQATAQKLARSEDALAKAKTDATTAAGKVRTAELGVDEARAKAQQRAEAVVGAEKKVVAARAQYGEGSKQAAAAEKQLEAAKKQSGSADAQLAAAAGNVTKARADLANATDNVKAKELSHKAVQEDVARSEKAAAEGAEDAAKSIKILGDASEDAEGKSSRFAAVQDKVKLGVAAVSAAAAATGAALFKVGQDFDEAYDAIRVGTGASGEAFEGLKESARNVYKEIPAMDGGFQQVGSTLADLNTRLGLTGEPLEKMTSQFVELSNMGIDADINDVSAALSAFGVEANQAPAAMDELFRASQATGLTISELAQSAVKGAPQLKEFGFDMAESAALVGKLDKAGVEADKVLAGMGKAMVQFAKDGREPQAALFETAREIENYLELGNEVEATNVAAKLFGTKGAGQFIEAVKTGALSIDWLMGNIGATEDTILGVAKETQSFSEKWALLKQNALAALEPIASKIFDALSPAMDAVLGGMERIAPWVESVLAPAISVVSAKISEFVGYVSANLIPLVVPAFERLGEIFRGLVEKVQGLVQWGREHQGVMAVLAGAAGGLAVSFGAVALQMKATAVAQTIMKSGGLIGWISKMITSTNLWAGAQKALNFVMNMNPYMKIITAIMTLAGALWAFFAKTETGREMWAKFTDALARGWDWFTEKLSAGWQWIKTSVWDPFMGFITGTLVPLWNAAWGLIQAAWDKFTSGLSWAWENIIKPVFDAIWTVAKATLGVIGTVILAPLILYWKAMSAAVQWGWENIIKPAWDALSTAASWMWDNVLKPTFGWIKDRWQDMVLGIQFYWENVWKPVLETVAEVAKWLWENVLAPAFEGIKHAWELMVDGIKWAWENILKPAWEAVKTAAQFMWDNVLRPTFDLIKAAWEVLSNAIKWAWESIIRPAWEALQNAANWLWDNVLKPVFDAIKSGWEAMSRGIEWVKDNVILPVFRAVQDGIDTLKGWFDRGVDAIGRTWEALRENTAAPIRWVVDTVYNNGIKKVWDNIAKFIGLGELPAVDLSFATGGVMPGYTPGRDVHHFTSPTGGRLHLSGGEAIMRPEWTRAVGGPKAVESMNRAAQNGTFVSRYSNDSPQNPLNKGIAAMGAYPEQAFAGGGVIGSITALVNRFFPGMTITSTQRASNDYHGQGLAVDFSNGTDTTPEMQRAAGFFFENYGPALLELIHSPFGHNVKHGQDVGDGFGFYGAGTMSAHRNHVHVAASSPLPEPGTPIEPVTSGGGGSIGGYLMSKAKGLWDDAMEKIKSALPDFAGMVGKIPSAFMETAFGKLWSHITSKIPFGGGGSGNGPGDLPGGVEQYRGLVEKILKAKGYDVALADTVLRRMNQESGGNAGAINNWDINAVNGVPSKGLMQVIDPTFQAHKDPGHDDIWDPEANIRASMNYAMARYGSLPAAYNRPGGYDSGGWLEPTPGGFSTYYNHTGKPEAVLTHDQWEGVSRLAEAVVRLVPALEGVPTAVEELAVSYRDGVGMLGDAVRAVQDNPLARAAGHLAGPLAELGKSAFETYSNLEPNQVMGNLAHGVVTGHLEDAAGLLGIPTEKPAWMDAAEQFRAAIPGAMTSARDSLASSIEKAKGKSQAPQAGALGLSDDGQAAKESGLAPVPEAVETAAQGQAPQGEGQDWASFAAGILGAGSVMELGRNAMHGGIELASMGASHGVGVLESMASQGWSAGVGTMQSMASAALNSGVSFASNALNAVGGSAGAVLNAVAPGAGAAVAPFLAQALPQAQMALSSLIPAGEMAIATAGTLADVYGQQAISGAGMLANIGIDQVAQAGGRMVDAGFDTVQDELPNMPLPGDTLAKLPEAAQSAGSELVGGAARASEITRRGVTYITNVGSKADAYEVTKHHQARELAGYGLTR